MVAVRVFLAVSIIIRIVESCSSEDDSYLGQISFQFGECRCREYMNSYATCYNPDGCVDFPRAFQTFLKCFKLQTSGVSKIIVGDLTNLTHLTGLYIESNKNLAVIEPRAFIGMKNLITLSISYNPSLMKLNENVFEGLNSLKSISLTRNGFEEFRYFTPSLKAMHLPNLTRIDLKWLNCPTLNEYDFVNLNGSGVTDLYFDGTKLGSIHHKALNHLTKLKKLSVGETLLPEGELNRILDELMRREINLESLNIKGRGFELIVSETIFKVISNSKINELVLNKNLLYVINATTFPKAQNIESLYLEQNLITDVKENSFSNFPKLKKLHLKYNKLVSIPNGLSLNTLKLLDVSSNTKPGISYFNIEKNNFVNMSSLETLDLSDNNLRSIFVKIFTGLNRLKELNLHKCNIVIILNDAFVELTGLQRLDLGQNHFPARNFHKDIFNGLGNLKYLSLRSCKITYIPSEDIFSHLTSLQELDLKENFLTEIAPNFILSLKNLKSLDLSNNQLRIWHENLFKNTKIENLTICFNRFDSLTNTMLEDIGHLKKIDISRSPFHCFCDTLVEPFNSFNQTQVHHILGLLNASTAFCWLPEAKINTTIVNYYENNREVCLRIKIEKLINSLTPALVCLAILVALTVIAYIYRWHIRYWIFLTRKAISKQTQFKKRSNLQGYTNYFYDAFVSYSSKDRNFVIRLVNMLENYEPFLKLCVYERDFEVGTIISESVLENLSRSRKTLLIVSNSYVKSQWCIWEAQVAENHRLFFENENGEYVNNSLIVIKLGNISSKNISPMLRYLMKTRIYLQWDSGECKQKEFWEKLRNVLRPPASIYVQDKVKF